MIGFIRGTVVLSSNFVNTITPEQDGVHSGSWQGVGYEVHCNGSPGVGKVQQLWIHEHAPQDAPHELYGFEFANDRDMFRRLLNVKGVGPKVAMRIIAANAINGNGVPVPATLGSVRGVGPKIVAAIMEEFS